MILRIDKAVYEVGAPDVLRLIEEFDLDGDDERVIQAVSHAYTLGAQRGIAELAAALIEHGADIRLDEAVPSPTR